MQLIYSSIDDVTINWTKDDLLKIKKEKLTFKRSKEYDILGINSRYNNADYYVLISAEDQYGNTKLANLKYILLTAFFISTILVWILSFYLSKKVLSL
jgi:predicted permease